MFFFSEICSSTMRGVHSASLSGQMVSFYFGALVTYLFNKRQRKRVNMAAMRMRKLHFN